MKTSLRASCIEPLENRIAPALLVISSYVVDAKSASVGALKLASFGDVQVEIAQVDATHFRVEAVGEAFPVGFAEVNSVSNEVTLDGEYPLVTGQTIRYTAGEGNVGGLVDGTTYHVIKVAPNRIKLAESYINAMAGTAKDLLDDGTSLELVGGVARTQEILVGGKQGVAATGRLDLTGALTALVVNEGTAEGAGSDNFSLVGIKTLKSLTFNGRGGDDQFSAKNVAVTGNVLVNMGAGDSFDGNRVAFGGALTSVGGELAVDFSGTGSKGGLLSITSAVTSLGNLRVIGGQESERLEIGGGTLTIAKDAFLNLGESPTVAMLTQRFVDRDLPGALEALGTLSGKLSDLEESLGRALTDAEVADATEEFNDSVAAATASVTAAAKSEAPAYSQAANVTSKSVTIGVSVIASAAGVDGRSLSYLGGAGEDSMVFNVQGTTTLKGSVYFDGKDADNGLAMRGGTLLVGKNALKTNTSTERVGESVSFLGGSGFDRLSIETSNSTLAGGVGFAGKDGTNNSLAVSGTTAKFGAIASGESLIFTGTVGGDSVTFASQTTALAGSISMSVGDGVNKLELSGSSVTIGIKAAPKTPLLGESVVFEGGGQADSLLISARTSVAAGGIKFSAGGGNNTVTVSGTSAKVGNLVSGESLSFTGGGAGNDTVSLSAQTLVASGSVEVGAGAGENVVTVSGASVTLGRNVTASAPGILAGQGDSLRLVGAGGKDTLELTADTSVLAGGIRLDAGGDGGDDVNALTVGGSNVKLGVRNDGESVLFNGDGGGDTLLLKAANLTAAGSVEFSALGGANTLAVSGTQVAIGLKKLTGDSVKFVGSGTGDDTVGISSINSVLSGGISASMGDGINSLSISGSSAKLGARAVVGGATGAVGESVSYVGGAGVDTVSLTAQVLVAGGSIEVAGGEAANSVTISGSSATLGKRAVTGDSLKLTGGALADKIELLSSTSVLAGGIRLEGSGGANVLNVGGGSVSVGALASGESVLFSGLGDNDSVTLGAQTLTTAGCVDVSAGAGNNSLEVSGTLATLGIRSPGTAKATAGDSVKFVGLTGDDTVRLVSITSVFAGGVNVDVGGAGEAGNAFVLTGTSAKVGSLAATGASISFAAAAAGGKDTVAVTAQSLTTSSSLDVKPGSGVNSVTVSGNQITLGKRAATGVPVTGESLNYAGGDSDDSVIFSADTSVLAGGISYDGGAGLNALTVSGANAKVGTLSTGESLVASGGGGSDTVILRAETLAAAGWVSVGLGNGENKLKVSGTLATIGANVTPKAVLLGASVVFRGGTDKDTVEVSAAGSVLSGGLKAEMGGGTNELRLEGASAKFGALGTGQSVQYLGTGSTSQDADTVLLRADTLTATGSVEVTTGNGSNLVEVSGGAATLGKVATGDSLKVVGGTSDDVVDVKSTALVFAGGISVDAKAGINEFRLGGLSAKLGALTGGDSVLFVGGELKDTVRLGAETLAATGSVSVTAGGGENSLTVSGTQATLGVKATGKTALGPSVFFDGGAGLDRVEILSATSLLAGGVSIDAKDGENSLRIGGDTAKLGALSTGHSLAFSGGSGADTVSIESQSSTTTGALKIQAFGGNNSLTLTGTSAVLGFAATQAALPAAGMGNSIEYVGLDGRDSFTSTVDSLTLGALSFSGGAGANSVTFGGTTVKGSGKNASGNVIDYAGGTGDDTLALFAQSVDLSLGGIVFDPGAGLNQVQVSTPILKLGASTLKPTTVSDAGAGTSLLFLGRGAGTASDRLNLDVDNLTASGGVEVNFQTATGARVVDVSLTGGMLSLGAATGIVKLAAAATVGMTAQQTAALTAQQTASIAVVGYNTAPVLERPEDAQVTVAVGVDKLVLKSDIASKQVSGPASFQIVAADLQSAGGVNVTTGSGADSFDVIADGYFTTKVAVDLGGVKLPALRFNATATPVVAASLANNGDSDSDVVTFATAHGLHTGDLVNYVKNADLRVVSGVITDGGTYYAVVENGTVKLADSLENAVAGNVLDIADTGGGRVALTNLGLGTASADTGAITFKDAGGAAITHRLVTGDELTYLEQATLRYVSGVLSDGGTYNAVVDPDTGAVRLEKDGKVLDFADGGSGTFTVTNIGSGSTGADETNDSVIFADGDGKAVSHGVLTGDLVKYLRKSNPALRVADGVLEQSHTYYAVVDPLSGAVKLAASAQDAVNGNVLGFGDDGAGIITLIGRGASADASADEVTFAQPHGLTAGQAVLYVKSAGVTLHKQAGVLDQGRSYYAVVTTDVDSNTHIRFAETSGDATAATPVTLDLADNGVRGVNLVLSADVSAAEDTLTFAANHGLSTGDMVSFGGATHYVVVTGAKVIKLAASAADAQAGTPVTEDLESTEVGARVVVAKSALLIGSQTDLDDTITFGAAHGLATGAKVSVGGNTYYVVNTGATTIQLAASAADATAAAGGETGKVVALSVDDPAVKVLTGAFGSFSESTDEFTLENAVSLASGQAVEFVKPGTVDIGIAEEIADGTTFYAKTGSDPTKVQLTAVAPSEGDQNPEVVNLLDGGALALNYAVGSSVVSKVNNTVFGSAHTLVTGDKVQFSKADAGANDVRLARVIADGTSLWAVKVSGSELKLALSVEDAVAAAGDGNTPGDPSKVLDLIDGDVAVAFEDLSTLGTIDKGTDAVVFETYADHVKDGDVVVFTKTLPGDLSLRVASVVGSDAPLYAVAVSGTELKLALSSADAAAAGEGDQSKVLVLLAADDVEGGDVAVAFGDLVASGDFNKTTNQVDLGSYSVRLHTGDAVVFTKTNAEDADLRLAAKAANGRAYYVIADSATSVRLALTAGDAAAGVPVAVDLVENVKDTAISFVRATDVGVSVGADRITLANETDAGAEVRLGFQDGDFVVYASSNAIGGLVSGQTYKVVLPTPGLNSFQLVDAVDETTVADLTSLPASTVDHYLINRLDAEQSISFKSVSGVYGGLVLKDAVALSNRSASQAGLYTGLGEVAAASLASLVSEVFDLQNVSVGGAPGSKAAATPVMDIDGGIGVTKVRLDNVTTVAAMNVRTREGADSVQIEQRGLYGISEFKGRVTIELGADEDSDELLVGRDEPMVDVFATTPVSFFNDRVNFANLGTLQGDVLKVTGADDADSLRAQIMADSDVAANMSVNLFRGSNLTAALREIMVPTTGVSPKPALVFVS